MIFQLPQKWHKVFYAYHQHIFRVDTDLRCSVGKAKPVDTRETADVAAAHKRARMEEADTFRGVHLDPNAHHWDEVCGSDGFVL